VSTADGAPLGPVHRTPTGALDGGAAPTLAVFPAVSGPAVTLEGDADGAPHPDPAAYELELGDLLDAHPGSQAGSRIYSAS